MMGCIGICYILEYLKYVVDLVELVARVTKMINLCPEVNRPTWTRAWMRV
jgi:hypothetical protein